jgi:3-oxoacyl-[acyl-carrier protein] reductase
VLIGPGAMHFAVIPVPPTSLFAGLPLKRSGEPYEVAPTAVLLASIPGGNIYTGQTLGPNSGDVML